MKEINGNFNTFDLSSSFDSASTRYQLDVIVAQWAEVLKQSPYAYGVSLRQLNDYVRRLTVQLPKDADVSEFAGLVSLSMQMMD